MHRQPCGTVNALHRLIQDEFEVDSETQLKPRPSVAVLFRRSASGRRRLAVQHCKSYARLKPFQTRSGRRKELVRMLEAAHERRPDFEYVVIFADAADETTSALEEID